MKISSSGLYKTEWKARVEAQKERGKVERGGKKSSASSYWHFFIELSFFSGFFVLLFIWIEWKKEKTSLSFSSFYPFDEFRLWPMPH